ncbi:MAG: hypothetical protein JXA97_10715 [Anaerolineales bacterium]|nr:hypothetical protein [Anaerolineales bacterium]
MNFHTAKPGQPLEGNGAPEAVLPAARSLCYFFHRQGWHLAAGMLLGGLAWLLARDSLEDGSFLRLSDRFWFWGSIAVPAIQQALGWLVFRGQLGWGTLTKWFGDRDLSLWGSVFFPLLAARPLFLIGLALSDAGSLAFPAWLRLALAILLLVPAAYTMWSVLRYFGVDRALGGDHFRLAYREMDFVREGAFRWSDNAMYAFVFLGLWALALLIGSWAALSIAAFQHAFVWAHYYCTEEPDMRLIYAGGGDGRA